MSDNGLRPFLQQGFLSISNVLIQNYREVGMTNQEFLVFMQLQSHINQGNCFPDMDIISKELDITGSDVYQLLNSMIKKNLIELTTEEDENHKKKDLYRTDLIYEKLVQLCEQKAVASHVVDNGNSRKRVIEQVEVEFGRTLSPIEMETIGYWVDEDHYDPEVITLALKEAVLNQAYNIRYIQQILISWERKHLTTKEMVQKELSGRNQF